MNNAEPEATLFHYTNAYGLIGVIRNREIWATESNYLNDPSEISFAAMALVQKLRSGVETPLTAEQDTMVSEALELLERAYTDPNSMEQYREDRTFITSFSRTDKSLTLWRSYSGPNGFCIGFDESSLLEWVGHEYPAQGQEGETTEERERHQGLLANYHLSGRIDDVSYGDASIAPLLDDLLALPIDDRADVREAHIRRVLESLASIKHAAFSDEREARLTVRELGHHAMDAEVRVSASGILVAFRKLLFPFGAVRSITMAPSANFGQTRKALESLLTVGGRGPWSHVDVRESDIPFSW